jgi:hypothetical protein
MIEIVKESLGIALLSFVIVYGMYYLGLAMESIFSYAYGMSDWEWE